MPAPDKFYYFTPLDTDKRKEWLRVLLREHRIFLRDPSKLNDINELRPRFVIDGADKELRSFAHDLFRKHAPVHLSPAQRLLHVARYVRNLRNDPRQFEEVLHQSLSRLGVLSLSAAPCDHTMWGHYAAGSTGVCVEFHAGVGLFGTAQEVAYAPELPVINRIKDAPDVLLQKSMFTKGEAWRNEQEWRVIARWKDGRRIAAYFEQHDVPADQEDFVRAQDGPGYYKFPPEAVARVILGVKCSDADERWVRAVIEGRLPSVPVDRILRGDDGRLRLP